MNVLVTGGGGYIGSHAVAALRTAGHTPIVLDMFDRGHRDAVPAPVTVLRVDLADISPVRLAAFMTEHKVEAVLHFAALAYVGESVREPLRYYRTNVAGTLNLLSAMDRSSVCRLVFSSTCATYGEPTPDEVPIRETLLQQPINPYGRSKLMVEQILVDYAACHPQFAHARLRYFNVAGCAADGSLGEDHRPETHLIPCAIRAALGVGPALTLFGNDYPTPDGTCIRDYVNVEDLVAGHLLVLDALRDGDRLVFNLGAGKGFSVREVLDAVAEVTGRPVPHTVGPRRPGDPAVLFADTTKIREALGWHPTRSALTLSIGTAARWIETHPRGYS